MCEKKVKLDSFVKRIIFFKFQILLDELLSVIEN
jgi:hypothetical protein